ncbi:uncharacterized protein LOC115437967 isoform X3 [Sphaeramia orbicularis]|uniref:uncharacterized protein LOC115437967 isoform X3 n=1 Tax=Sphaeramia orbicularis TaxID=375764 RepID=UPI00117D1951|nr:uncharacterized protein LOC115437967 isoform X3 [Sphaeramia orbicularis]
MKVLVVVGLLIHVSQHALAVVVQAYEGMESVLLPYQYSGMFPEVPFSVVWKRSDLNQTVIHLLKYDNNELKDEYRHSERMSVKKNVLETGDFSLTVKKPQLSDSSNYTCNLQWETEREGPKEWRMTQVQLQVKDDQKEVEVQQGAESIRLPCKASADLPEDTTVDWTHFDPELMVVHVSRSKTDDLQTQDRSYRDRTQMNEDMSLTLKKPTDTDGGVYICTVYREGDVLRSKVLLQVVPEGFPAWATALLVVFAVLLLILLGRFFIFRGYFQSVYEVEVDSGEESVLLPCKTIAHLTKNSRQISVMWKNLHNQQILVHMYGSGKPDEQDQDYTDRTEMKKHWLRTGDFSLTLKHPTDWDTNSYVCTIYNRDKVLENKRVVLKVRVQQVEGDSEEESVLLPWKTTLHIEDVSQLTVEWTARYNRKVHVYEDGSDRTNEQNYRYRNRTEMKEDPLRTGDLSLTLKHPTDWDSDTYTCTVYNRDKQILRRKQVRLKVKVQQVEGDSEEESVLLPWKTTLHIEDVSQLTVEWTARYNRKVHVYVDGSDRTNEQNHKYRNRTEMKEDPLRTGDLSLTLKHPTDWDSDTYTCTVYNRDKQILRRKQVKLKVKDQQVEGDSEEESVLLPWKTTLHIEDVSQLTVEWTDDDNRKVHVYEDGSDRTNEQDEIYRNRTEMKEDPLRTGDLSLTLKHPTDWDTDTYTCTVYNRDKQILRRKRVSLEVKVQQVEVEVDSEEESVLLPWKTTLHIEDVSQLTVEWTARYNRKVHVYEDGSDRTNEQNYRYRNRTEMKEDPLRTGDLSLTLKHPTDWDTDTYTCTVYNRDKQILRRKQVRLKVKVQQVEVDSEKESVLLSWKTTLHKEDISQLTVEWTDDRDRKVHVYEDGSDRTNEQNEIYRNRTEMKEDPLRTGDLSLTLKHPTDWDTDTYTCTVYNRDKQILRRKRVSLEVKVQLVEVDSGEESVLLPCQTIAHLTKNSRQISVMWKNLDNHQILVHKYGSGEPDEQDQDYTDRTEMKKHWLRTGDFSLTLKNPMDWDANEYLCTIYNKDKVLKKKRVVLKVRVQQVEVDSEEESVLLPWKTTLYIEDVSQLTVEWTDHDDRKVHVYEDGSDRTNEQDEIYRNRTEMKEDPLRTGDLSLTLKHPTDWDTDTYTCTVYNRDKQILRRKLVDLEVKVQQVEGDSEEESVLLPWKTTLHIEDVSQLTVEWTDDDNRKVHVYEDGSDRTNEQDEIYRNRTEMKEDPLRTGDLSLTLKHPTDWDTDTYTCTVYNRDKQILRRKLVDLEVKVQQVEEGAWSALLPFRTTPDLPQDARVEWRYYTNDLKYIHVHVSEKKSAQPGEQDDRYRNRTKMNEDPWTTGDCSLTLNDLQQDDSGTYVCVVIRDGDTLRGKTVELKVKGQSSDAGQRSGVSLSSVSSADRSQITYQFPPIREDAEAEAAV